MIFVEDKFLYTKIMTKESYCNYNIRNQESHLKAYSQHIFLKE